MSNSYIKLSSGHITKLCLETIERIKNTRKRLVTQLIDKEVNRHFASQLFAWKFFNKFRYLLFLKPLSKPIKEDILEKIEKDPKSYLDTWAFHFARYHEDIKLRIAEQLLAASKATFNDMYVSTSDYNQIK